MNKQLTGGGLESELSQIIRERDDLCEDPFEDVANRATILDLHAPPAGDEFMPLLIDRLTASLKLPRTVLAQALANRELGPASEFMPGVAVSDLVVPGDDFFELGRGPLHPGRFPFSPKNGSGNLFSDFDQRGQAGFLLTDTRRFGSNCGRSQF